MSREDPQAEGRAQDLLRQWEAGEPETVDLWTGCGVNPSTGVYDEAAGIKKFAVSAYNCVDTIGNVWEWLSDYSNRHDTTSWAWQDVLGAGMGQAYLPNAAGLTAFIAGGHWDSGVHCGPRAVSLGNSPWNRGTSVGSRLACDAA